MTRKKWTNAAQLAWLQERCAAFAEAEANDTCKEFFQGVFADWLKLWPNTAEIDEAGSKENAVKAKDKDQFARIKTWFRNHKRPPVAGGQIVKSGKIKAGGGILKLHKRRVWQPWQAYHNLTYETRWKAEIDEQWQVFRTSWQNENPGQPFIKTRFEFMNAFIKEKFETETPEMKAQVEEHRHKMSTKAPDEINDLFQDAIEKLPRSIASAANSIQEQTGWCVTIMVGGPMPREKGQIATLVYHAGKTKDGMDFEAYLGKEKFETLMSNEFDEFLHQAFTAEDRAERALENNGDDEGAGKGDSDDERPAATGSTSVKPALSEYEAKKQKNIAELKVIMADIRKEYGGDVMSDLTAELRARKQKGKKQDRVDVPSAERSSARLGMENGYPNPSSSAEGIPVASTTLLAGSAIYAATDEATVDLEPTKDGEHKSSGPELQVVDVLASATADFDKQSETLDMPSTPTHAVAIASALGEVALGEVKIPSTSAMSQGNLTFADGEMPSFLSLAIVGYLGSVSASLKWQALLLAYFDFEKGGPQTGKLPTDSRPQEVALWIKRHLKKKHEAVSVLPDEYGPRFVAWWRSIQPSWRILPDGSYAKATPDDENWASLGKGGSAGLYIVVVALSWWIRVLDLTSDNSTAWDIVDDVLWVIQQIRLKNNVPNNGKRARNEEDAAKANKRHKS